MQRRTSLRWAASLAAGAVAATVTGHAALTSHHEAAQAPIRPSIIATMNPATRAQ